METLEITSNKITLSDPCYELGTWCMIQDIPFPNGVYRVHAEKQDIPNWGERVCEIAVYNKDIVPENEGREMDILWEELDGEVGVDSGMAGIYDSEYYKKSHKENSVDENWYNEVCNIFDVFERVHYGVKDNSCVVSSSGFGDGGYTAYIGKLGDKTVAAKIVFIDETDFEDEEVDEEE